MVAAYPLWLILFVLAPLVIVWVAQRTILRRYGLAFFACLIGAVAFSFPWDLIAIRERIWYFESPYISGVWLLGLPVEEWCFIVLVTLLFSSVTVILWEKYGVMT
jgi:lycopene cyclase domain-containing protein